MLKILNRDLLSNPMYVINNLHIYDWESDFLAITRSLYAYEVEVKMSKQDFFNDFKKDKKHKVLKDGMVIPVAEIQGFHTFASKNPICFSYGSMSIGRKELFQTCMLTRPRKERRACVPELRL